MQLFVDTIMNRTQSIAVFAGIFAIAMTTYGLSGVSASPMIMASTPQTQEAVGMLGHVDYTVLDNDGQIKTYLQSDNIVVEAGKDCAGELVFGATSGSGACGTAGQTFRYIAIGNGTQGELVGDIELSGDQCAATGANGEMARKLVVPTVDVGAGGSNGAQVVLDVGTNTFTFAGNFSSAGTTVTQSGLFNGISSDQTYDTYDGALGNGQCSGAGYGTVGTHWQMFSIQDLSGGGVGVSPGDSLAVKWTITLN